MTGLNGPVFEAALFLDATLPENVIDENTEHRELDDIRRTGRERRG